MLRMSGVLPPLNGVDREKLYPFFPPPPKKKKYNKERFILGNSIFTLCIELLVKSLHNNPTFYTQFILFMYCAIIKSS